jgi:hypothetical protein
MSVAGVQPWEWLTLRGDHVLDVAFDLCRSWSVHDTALFCDEPQELALIDDFRVHEHAHVPVDVALGAGNFRIGSTLVSEAENVSEQCSEVLQHL